MSQERKRSRPKVAQSAKDQTDVAPKPKAKRKLVIQKNNYERISSPPTVKKAKTLKTKPAAIPGVLTSFLSTKPAEAVVAKPAVPKSIVQSQTE